MAWKSGTAGLMLSLAMLTPAQALKIELKDAAPDRIERQRLTARGETLPGTPEGTRDSRLEKLDLKVGKPVLIRIFKEESELELWMLKGEKYVKFATYPICHWSGTLGPKMAEGDKQSPEGFYTVNRRLLHWSGRWPRSLNLGFPNVFDRSLLRTGSYILIHGGCTSVGCYAMTNPVIKEVFGLVEKALRAGQRHVPVHVFPFRFTEANLKRHEKSEWMDFWQNLKAGYDSFERTHLPPNISVCNGHYQVRDAIPSEVGSSSRPLDVCARTAEVLAAEDELQSIVSRPSQWPKLTTKQKRLVNLLTETPKQILQHRNTSLAKASSAVTRGKRGRKTYVRAPAVKVTCNLRRPSCRKHMALKRKRAAKLYAAKQRRAKRQVRVSSRRKNSRSR
ncbi:MAG: murein L,D-transpeptidase family protein [Filomicrobium sp.]